MNDDKTTRPPPMANLPGAALLVSLLPLLFWNVIPYHDWVLPEALFLPLHSIAEVFAVVVAAQIFFTGVANAAIRASVRSVWLTRAFLAVALLDLLHLLSYAGMPDLFTANTPHKAIVFWLAARIAAALALLAYVLLPAAGQASAAMRRRAGLAAMLWILLAVWATLLQPDLLPPLFVPGQGLSDAKIATEWLVAGLNLAAAFILLWQRRAGRADGSGNLLAALLLMATGEFFFTLYTHVNDAASLAGHAYKVAAYYYLYRAVFVEAIREPVLDLERSEQARRESEARFRALVETSSDWIWEVDAQGRYTYASPKIEELLGYTAEEVLGKTPFDLMPPDEAARVQVLFTGIAGEKCPFHGLRNLNIARDGRHVWLETSGVPILGPDGSLAGYRGMDRDISARMEAEVRYRLLADNVTDMITLHAPDGTLQYVSPASRALLGCEPEELLGRNAYDLFFPKDIVSLRQRHTVILAEPGSFLLEYRIRRQDGSDVWVETATRSVSGEAAGKEGGIVAVTRDISQRKTAEAAIVRTEEILRRAQSVAHVGSWYLDVAAGTLEWSDETYRMFGLPKGSRIDYEAFLACVHPDDRRRVDLAWRGALDGGPYDIEHRIVVDGAQKWVRERAELTFDAEGHVLGGIGTVQDITALKEKEVELLGSRQKLRELAAYHEKVREDERAHIAREIHDELGQYLTALRMDAALLQIGFGGDPRLAERIDGMKKLIDQTIAVVRSVASSLRPGALDLGLVSAAEWLVSEFESRTGVHCGLKVMEGDWQLDDALATVVFRILQESLTNVTRHARARHVEIGLQVQGGMLGLTVRDDGVGFDPAEVREKRTFGLMGIRERALILGGAAAIDSRPGQGTSLQVTIPLHAKDAREGQ